MNRMGIGAKVRVYKAGEMNRHAGLLGFKEVGIGDGFGSGQVASAHFGIGSVEEVDVSVIFPDGTTVILRDLDPDRQLTVEELPPGF
jgi:hypothetical protein